MQLQNSGNFSLDYSFSLASVGNYAIITRIVNRVNLSVYFDPFLCVSRMSHESPSSKRHRRSNSQATSQQRMHQRTVSTEAKPRKHTRTASVEVKTKPQEQPTRTTRTRTRTASVDNVPVKPRSGSASRPAAKSASFDQPKKTAPAENKKTKLTMPATPSFMK